MPLLRMKDLRGIALVMFAVSAHAGHAAGLGAIAVQSGLGQPLHVSIALIGADPAEDGSQCIKAKVSSLDGVVAITPKSVLTRNARSAAIQLSTHQNLNELAVNVSVSVGCTATVHRDYQILLDPVIAAPEQEPLPTTSARLSGGDAGALPMAAMPADMNTGERSRRRHAFRKPGTNPAPPKPQQTLADFDTEIARTPLKKVERLARPKTKKISHDVLTLTIADEETSAQQLDGHHVALNLKLATILSAAASENDPQTLAEIRAQQARFAAALSDEDPGKAAEMRVKSIQDEMQALRVESGRIKQQDQSKQAALQATRSELLMWVGGLGVVLLACLAAIGWLLWRLALNQKNEARASWDRIMEDREPDSDEFLQSDDNTDLNYAATFNDTDWPKESDPLEADLHVITAEQSVDFALAVAPGGDKSPAPYHAAVAHVPYAAVARPDLDNAINPSQHMLKVEEVLDITELAEVWTALHHDPVKLLELLEPFKDVEKPESPLPWLCLLDVYHSIGDSQKYEATRQRIKKVFNVKMASWDAEAAAGPIQTMADFPHIREKILDLWDSKEIVPYLLELLNDQRDGTRTGFDLPVFRTIMQLLKLASAPDRSKWHDRKAYAVLFGTPGTSDGGAMAAKPVINQVDAANSVKLARPDRPLPAKSNLSVARRESAVREWLAAESTTQQQGVPTDAPASVPLVVSGKKPVRKPVKTENSAAPEAAISRRAATNIPAPTADAVDIYAKRTTPEVPALLEPWKDAADCEAMSTMSIRLHLAISYQDIGDEEGARLLLDEVIKGGTPEQCAQAKSILAQIRLVSGTAETDHAKLQAFR